MKILYTSDIHASENHLSSMLKIAEKAGVDCVIIGGDLIPYHPIDNMRFGILKAQARYLEKVFIPAILDFKGRTGTRLFLDTGNDDFLYNRRILEKYDYDLFHLIHFNKFPLTEDIDIIGYMNVPPTPFKIKDRERPDSREAPYAPGNNVDLNGYISVNGILEEINFDLNSEETIEHELDKISEYINRPFIFVSHSPPYNSLLDVINNGTNVGSLSIRRFIEKWSEKGLLVASFHGHIHESPQRSGATQDKIGNVPCINPGQGNGRGSEFRYVIFELSQDRISFFI